MAAMSPGRRALIALMQVTSGREIAARAGVAPSRVSEWGSGLTAPSDEPRRRLWRIYGISPTAWQQPVNPVYMRRLR
jgi:hypothetical protein